MLNLKKLLIKLMRNATLYQEGSASTAGAIAAGDVATVSVTFPTAYRRRPLVCVNNNAAGYEYMIYLNNVTATGFVAKIYNYTSSPLPQRTFRWQAMGNLVGGG